jgi:prepilin-type N-terminal cleavage/methylation domain-containing protein/prepilin-type processing-associated H-X9-DG protein
MKKKGFTLIEQSVAMAMIGILAVLLLPALVRAQDSRDLAASCANNLKQYGLSLKMYANESRGERYPPVHFEISHIDHVNINDPNPEPSDRFIASLSPRIYSIYPEYMNDSRITICPSDSANGLLRKDDLNCVLYDNSWDEGSTDPNIKEGCIDNLDDSYTYLGWVFDKDGNDGDPTQYDTPLLEHSWKVVGVTMDYRKPEDAVNDALWFPVQSTATFTRAQNSAWIAIADAFSNNPDGHKRFLDAWDDDQSLDNTVVENFDASVDYGNANSNIVFRLREGIERFLITDINAPGASPNAQSRIYVMYDRGSSYPAGTNHIPGGSNVLYLDGHVEFVRHDAKPPVKAANAHITGVYSILQ